MERIIVNADDCGMSIEVDKAIRDCIINYEISSTSIMANMDDFDGACRLYKDYHQTISFGFHINLTEGKPLTSQKELVDCGIAEINNDNDIVLCGNKQRMHYYNSRARKAIADEIEAQLKKILGAGINVSHIDSHHHIHTDFWILLVVIKLAKKYNIRRIRCISNYTYTGTSCCARYCWKLIVKMLYPQVVMTDYFTSYRAYFKTVKKKNINNKTIELMTHPGGYEPDETILMSNYSNLIKEMLVKSNNLPK